MNSEVENYNAVAMVVFLVVSLPFAAWLGAKLMREGGPLHALASRHFRVSIVVVAIGCLAASSFNRNSDLMVADVLHFGMALLAAMMFMPVVWRAQKQTENLRVKR